MILKTKVLGKNPWFIDNSENFSREFSLKEMIKHIYGKKEIENHTDRPNMFVKELGLYVSYLSNQINEAFEITPQQIKKWETFKTNLLNGIDYGRKSKDESIFKIDIKSESQQHELESAASDDEIIDVDDTDNDFISNVSGNEE